MVDLVRYIVESLVDNKDGIEINEEVREGVSYITIKVDPDDIGKVIGKQGRIAKAIRTVARAAAVIRDQRVVVDIL